MLIGEDIILGRGYHSALRLFIQYYIIEGLIRNSEPQNIHIKGIQQCQH